MRRKKTTHQQRSREKPDLTDIKKSLGPLAARYTQSQLCQLDQELSVGAALLIELFLEQRRAELKSRAVFDSPDDGG